MNPATLASPLEGSMEDHQLASKRSACVGSSQTFWAGSARLSGQLRLP